MRTHLLVGVFGAVVLLLVAFALAVALLPSCGLRLGTFGELNFCRAASAAGPSAGLAAERGRRAALEDRVRRLERQLAGLPHCPLPEPPPPPPPPPPPEPEPDPEKLDAERWEEQDTALLEGCWSLDSDYRLSDRETGTVTQVDEWEMCFDAEGQGSQRLVKTDGAECTAEVTAAFVEDGRLQVSDRSDVDCDDGSYIYQRIITCELEPNGEADCRARQPEIGLSTSSVRITRRVSE